MELSEPGPRPFQHRSTENNKKGQGSGNPELTEIVDEIMIETWETRMLDKDKQSLWVLNCLIYAGGKVVMAMEVGIREKVSKKGKVPLPPNTHTHWLEPNPH